MVGTAGKMVTEVGSSQNERREVHSQPFPTFPGTKYISFPSLAQLSEPLLVFPLHRKDSGEAWLEALQWTPE